MIILDQLFSFLILVSLESDYLMLKLSFDRFIMHIKVLEYSGQSEIMIYSRCHTWIPKVSPNAFFQLKSRGCSTPHIEKLNIQLFPPYSK